MIAARAMYIDVDGQPVSVWLHLPASECGEGARVGARSGVVMCPAWGREETSSHGPWRAWAQALAHAGIPCLRLDYPGEGDAWGRPDEASRLNLWVRAAEVAAEHLRAQSGVEQISMMGLRWGAVVAWLAALRSPLVHHVLAVAPVVRGRTYVRELAALQGASSGEDEALARAGGFQSGGFVLDGAEVERWSAVDLGALDGVLLGKVSQVDILDRDDLPSADKWGLQLRAQGVAVSTCKLADFSHIMADPHHACLPQAWCQASIEVLKAWMVDMAGMAALSREPGDPAPLSTPRPMAAHDQATFNWHPLLVQNGQLQPEPGTGCQVTERFLELPGAPACGVLSMAAGADAPASGQAVLLLNAGSTHHIGTSRLWVELARTWAAAGHLVLRLDLAGLGDADPRPGCPVNQTYPHEAVADVGAAVRWLQSHPGVRHVMAGGVCAGGYHALAAVRGGVPLQAILMINPLVYMDAEGLDLSLQSGVGAHQAQSAMASYRRALLSPVKWLKLLSGGANLQALGQVVSRRLGALGARLLRSGSRMVGMPLHNDLARVLRDAMDAGAHVHLYFSPDDPGLPMLREELGGMFDKLSRRPQWHCTVLPGGDHVFTRWSDRMALLTALLRAFPGKR
jgi:dienelactone hydrolase